MSLDRKRAEISAIVAEIEAIPKEVRDLFRQDDDCEAYEVVRRIERRLRGLPVAEPEEPAA